MVDIAQRLSTLSTRPPTPPKDRSEHIIDTSSPNGYFAHISNHILLDTPNESPSSSAEYFAGSVEKATKRVIFSPWHECHKPAGIGGKSSIAQGNLRRLPPSRDCKSSRSILKPSTGMLTSSPAGELPRFDCSDFPRMICSTMAHLRSASRTSRLDAYSALLGSLGAYDDLPDTQAMANNLPEFLEHIRRDMSATIGVEKATLDTQLATQSLKLLTILLCMPVLADSLPDEFSSYVLDNALSCLQDRELPKSVVIHYMQVLAKQNFARKLMTNERVHRLLLIMKDLTDYVKGNSVTGLRLRIYGRLLIQAKHIMAFNATDWLDQLVSGLLSSTREIRSLSVAFGIDAGIALGNISSVSQAVFEMFNRKSPDGQTVAGFLTNRLLEMTTSKDDAQHVPQVWSAMILLLRNRRHQLERWLHLKPWLLVMQKCLNSSDARVKSLAMTAWNRLVLAINVDTTTGSPMINMLRQPVVSHLNRSGGDKTSKQIRQLAHSSYCNLLYYAFRPSATHAQLDLYWEQYVDQILPESFSASKRDSSQACSILAALFHSSTPRPWDENRANMARFIKPDELPCIDPKWIRSRSHKIIKVFEKLITIPECAHKAEEEVLTTVVWQNFTLALGDASKQEVKVSFESMSAVAHIFNFLTRLWNRTYIQRQTPSQVDSSVAIAGMHSMIRQAIDNIGAITFNEKRLLRSAKNQFEPAETPSSRLASVQGTLNSPIVHLLGLFVSTVKESEAMEDYQGILRCLLDTALHSASSRVSQLALLRELTDLIASENAVQTNSMIFLWQIIAEATEIAVKRVRSTDGSIQSPQHAGREFRDVTGILEAGICQPSAMSAPIWQRLISAVCDCVRTEAGDGGIVVAIVEPMSAAINNKLESDPDNFLLSCATSLMQKMTWLQCGQDIERARRLLWGLPIANQRPSALNLYDNFCKMVDRILAITYRTFTKLDPDGVCALLDAMANALESCSVDVMVGIVRRIQQGIACWLEDTHGIIAVTASDTCLGRISRVVRRLWSIARATIEKISHNNASLVLYQGLVISCLRSRHRAIVNDAISSWNKTFGTVSELEYPEGLLKPLAKLREITEIELPCFPELENVDLVSSPFNFIDSQEADEGKARSPTPKPLATIENPTAVYRASSTTTKSSRNHSMDASPCAKSAQRLGQRRVSKTPQKVRLRHNDSQVQFAAIEMSSPLNSAAVSSPVVTDHQIEIKERQSREVAMFPELGSSPQPLSGQTDRQLPRLDLSGGKHCHEVGIDPDAQISPLFPIIDGTLESFLGSSPTPRAAMKNTFERASTSRQPLRSPPVTAQAGNDQRPVAAQVYESEAYEKKELEKETKRQTRILDAQCDTVVPDMFEEKSSSTHEEHEVIRGDATETRSLDEELVHKSTNMNQANAVLTRAPKQPPPENEVDIQTQASFPTPTSLARAMLDGGDIGGPIRLDDGVERPATPDIAADDETTSRVTDSFHSQSSFYSNDDEQISAQLAADMERASSQAQLVPSRPKRKRNAPGGPRQSKRMKGSSRTQSCHVVVETRRPQDLGEDCIIIDTRNAVQSPRAQSPAIKRERSSSPGILNAALVEDDTARGSLCSVAASNLVTGSPRPTSPSSSHSQDLHTTPTSPRPSKRRSTRLSEASEAAIDSQPHSSVRERHPKAKRPAAAIVQTLVDDAQKQNVWGVDHNMQSAPDAHADTIDRAPIVAMSVAGAVQEQEQNSDEPLKPIGPQWVKDQDVGASLLFQHQEFAASKDQSRDANGTNTTAFNEENDSSLRQSSTTSQKVLEGFQRLLEDIKQVTFRAEDERSMVRILFECVKEVHDAGRRHPER